MSDQEEEHLAQIREMMWSGYAKGWAKRFQASFFNAEREERRHRVDYVIMLSVELQLIRQTSEFCTGLGKLAIENLLEGNYDELKRQGDEDFVFDREGEEIAAKYNNLWSRFRVIITRALELKPSDTPREDAH